ncbi:uncharacterized protein LOC123319267 [Coccinella septempunctata]|uniref:uncharacterized protein LOC123319248 n=1 Tax=Coccinella septempunctata TaxID=41139 RepID=UPI001D098723|nr:uncharacterized protein LOC123319248 [Coccinella septempunctata]XP_044762062.1 uncharacterized protein LOC123319255 [Coccinella septempunctata]XP_044762071.1 uncharacterized protein LOC123319266 [Coccinella septempunctata]XP_044762073.1 uncharacterized protein LOC123319267 [Coccinella septempunctata]
MIEFYFDSSYFSFGGNIYLQLDGSAMDNPLSPILAEIAMDELVSSVLANLPFVLPFFWLYVDDSITAVPEEEFDTILDYFNAFNPKLQFTMETERDNKLAFLDVEVHRKECGTLLTNWFTKPTSSGRILNYHSYNPIGHKLSTVKGLLHRMMNLIHHTFHDSNLRTIKNILKMNNYPNTFVNKCLNSYFRQHRAFNNSEKPPCKFYKFPCIDGLSQRISTVFDSNTKLAFYNVRSTKCLYTRLKDPTPLLSLSNVIYKIPCSCGKSYIGQTKQYLKSRISQHTNDCKNQNQNKPNKTALASHHFETGHSFILEDVTVLDREANWFKRNVGEMIQINLADTVNLRSDCANLSIIYSNILNIYARQNIKFR